MDAFDRNTRSATVRIIAGLGNPGPEYENNRHNAGFMIIDRAAQKLGIRFRSYGRLARVADGKRGEESYRLVKPMTWMNRSGRAVGDMAVRLLTDMSNLLVVSDDFNLPLGKLRFRSSGSAGGHNGLTSVIRALGTEDFPRMRFGIGLPDGAEETRDFVLSDFGRKAGGFGRKAGDFGREESESFERNLERAAEAGRFWIETGDLSLCMNRYNGDDYFQ